MHITVRKTACDIDQGFTPNQMMGSAFVTSSPPSTCSANLLPSEEESVEEFLPQAYFSLGYNDVHHTFSISSGDCALLNHHKDPFLISLSRSATTEEDNRRYLIPQSAVSLTIQYIKYLLDRQVSRSATRSLLQAFEREFLGLTEIHTLVSGLPDTSTVQKDVLKTYFSALSTCWQVSSKRESALLSAAASGRARLYLVFGGQGIVNPLCVQELKDLYYIYQPFLEVLINVITPVLDTLSQLPTTKEYYHGRHLNPRMWLQDSKKIPDQDFIATAAVSFPVIGLLSLAHYCVSCKVLGRTPGELRSLLKGVSGHSQGIVVAAGIARSDSWESFYDTAKLVIEILFWMGYESHHAAPRSSLSSTLVTDSVEHGEGLPSSLLSVRGLRRSDLDAVIAKCNKGLPVEESVYFALANARDNFVVAGPARSLRGLNLHLRELKANDDSDQNRTPFNLRKPIIHHRFLPISAPFHTPYLKKAAEIIKMRLSTKKFDIEELEIPVYHTRTGTNLRESRTSNLMDILVDAVTCEPVDWPAAMDFSDASHILVLGGGRIGDLVSKNKEGEGVRIIKGSELGASLKDAGTKSELFAPHLTASSLKATSWGDDFQPTLVKSITGEINIVTKLTKVLGTPPIMVTGMTPTTVAWDFVAAVMNAGYHVELAGGGYFSAEVMSAAIAKIVSNVPRGRGITCNLIYVSPQAIAWQIPMLRQLISKGVPIDGLTIGAGVPSPEIAADYIETLGLKHISFKPGTCDAIRRVIAIATAHHPFPVILQWTGGRGGGHHSFEDFHAPILSTYSEIRKCSNITLVAGSGFGDAQGSYPYLTGSWARRFGYPLMPFDGILLGSRVMVATEAHTSPQSKKLILDAKGVNDSEWEKSYKESAGGIISVQSEMGQPIHKIATRGVLFWAEMDRVIFALPRDKRVAELKRNRDYIICRLNADFAKPWFGVNTAGCAIDLAEMTYAEVLARLISLMYIAHQKRWIDQSYTVLVSDFATRTLERLSADIEMKFSWLDPTSSLKSLLGACPKACSLVLHPEDVSFFLSRCKARGQKPVNFVPSLDEDFEYWFKKDSLWQSEDIDAVVNQDAGRVCILHGPVSAQYSHSDNESAKDILDGIYKPLVAMVRRDFYGKDAVIPLTDDPGNAAPSSINLENISVEVTADNFTFRPTSSALPKPADWFAFMSNSFPGWIRALFANKFTIQGCTQHLNPFRRILKLRYGDIMHIDGQRTKISLDREISSGIQRLVRVSSLDGFEISVDLYQPTQRSSEVLALQFKFRYDPQNGLYEYLDQRNDRIRSFYCKLWLGHDINSSGDLSSIFHGEEVVLTATMLQDFVSTIGESYSNDNMSDSGSRVFPLDYCIVIAWNALVQPLVVKNLHCDLLRLVHRSNTIEYCSEATALSVGDVLKTKSQVQAIIIEEAGKSVVVRAEIERSGKPVVIVTSTFLIRGSFADYSTTFQHTEEPETEHEVKYPLDEALLRDQRWLILNDSSVPLVGKTLAFRLRTHVTWKNRELLSSLQTTGLVFSRLPNGHSQEIGRVCFKAYDCVGNPVKDFLSRKGVQTIPKHDLTSPGWSGELSNILKIPSSNDRYGRISKDYNPIHVSPIFASYAGLPGTITHGMYTSAAVRGMLEHLAADGDRLRFRRFSTNFTGMVLPGDKLSVGFQHIAMIQGRMILKFWTHKIDTGEKVLEGDAEIEQVTTTYAFTGQGSQSQGMGMTLYNSSHVAKKVWDDADRYLFETYGKL